jgi:signal transduction histidine kinase
MKASDRFSDALPDWMRSVRFRLTLIYSTVLFLLAAVLVATLYFALLNSLQEEPVSEEYVAVTQDGTRIDFFDAENFERAVNEHTLANLKRFSFSALGVLFVVSLGVGWVVSGRVLAPIDRITDVARRIQATDLSRRIALLGPQDELKRLADTFDSMLARLDTAFGAQRRFVADASHELRNPLAIIKTNLDVALSDNSMSEQELRETARIARGASERMSRLVDDLLALARLDSAAGTREPVDISDITEEIASEFAALAFEHSIDIEQTLEPDMVVEADRLALKRAIANLVDNAIRFAPQGSDVQLTTGHSDGRFWVSVTDRGPGIAPSDHARIFDRFWRADRSRSRAYGGSGLGLAIVKEVAQAHSGDVVVSSELGRGATFTLWLPEPRTRARDKSSEPAAQAAGR